MAGLICPESIVSERRTAMDTMIGHSRSTRDWNALNTNNPWYECLVDRVELNAAYGIFSS